jgi:restriction system protein
MSRRDFLLDVGAKIPWQVSVIAAVALFVTMRLTTNVNSPVPTPATMAPLVLDNTLRFSATILQYVVPALLLIVALASALIRKRDRASYSAEVDARGANAIRNLTWRQFEKFLNVHFAQRGFAVHKTGKPGPDGGVNLKLRRGKDKYFVQCKQWRARQVEAAPVRDLYRVMARSGAGGGIVVTAGTFSDEARKFAEGRKIELIGGQMLETLMRRDHRQPGEASKSAAAPQCPACGSPMSVRVARKGANAGKSFWGCPRFPECRGMLPT